MDNHSENRKKALQYIGENIHRVEGFDPYALAKEATNENGEKFTYLPVIAQIAWFRLEYPNGKLPVAIRQDGDEYIAEARVYMNYQDTDENYLAKATASRRPDPDRPKMSAREWAQTAALGVALRNAGFGLQFDIAGDFSSSQLENTDLPLPAPVSQSSKPKTPLPAPPTSTQKTLDDKPQEPETQPPDPAEQKDLDLQAAMAVACPIAKYKGKTLGDLISIDPGALKWISEKYSQDPQIQNAARLLCESVLSQANA